MGRKNVELVIVSAKANRGKRSSSKKYGPSRHEAFIKKVDGEAGQFVGAECNCAFDALGTAGYSKLDNAKRFTGYISWGKGVEREVEEIDVDAVNIGVARKLIEHVMKSDYNPGGRVSKVIERHGLYL